MDTIILNKSLKFALKVAIFGLDASLGGCTTAWSPCQ